MTGAEALQKIIDSVDELKNTVKGLETSVKLIEANIKILNNRAAGLMRGDAPKQAANVFQATTTAPPSSNTFIPEIHADRGARMATMAQASQQVAAQDVEANNVLTYKKVFGKLVNKSNEPIENVLIKVFDKNNEVCATAETDAIGYWESMLRPGRYVVEYTKQGFKSTNKTFEVGKNAKEVEVK